ncbi:hypothetical protein OEZ85_006034 [Tetradesmus obliquus]|uniref:TF-B3 domain-containing protein n=1 Tax=Tetradesmus obliquus TaxID=3088 RepID=A0ABY8UFA6_TETOB|nr:hypothetical protein OEZ85_006034 [Tetradesmus obliquus]
MDQEFDCAVVYYIKQLSPSDAASSKQIKLPKTEARRFCGDLRHKQRSMVTVLDHRQVSWEFLCTCYGCQYALSRVAVFCNSYQLRAGQYLLFYKDNMQRLRIAVTGSLPAKLQQQLAASRSSGSAQKRQYSQMMLPPAAVPEMAAAAPYSPHGA